MSITLNYAIDPMTNYFFFDFWGGFKANEFSICPDGHESFPPEEKKLFNILKQLRLACRR